MKYRIIKVNDNGEQETFSTEQRVNTTNFRDICRTYLTNPAHLGERLQVVRMESEQAPESLFFDVTSVKHSTGKIQMTLYKNAMRGNKRNKSTTKKDTPQSAVCQKQETVLSPTGASKISPARLPMMPDFSGPDGLKEMYDFAKDIFTKVRQNDNDIDNYVIGYPILWFGSLDDYQKSELKILTVGLNPSLAEFPNDSFSRFPAWKDISSQQYFDGLNNYFSEVSYNWFDKLANSISLSNVWDCAYVPEKNANTALHIDYYSPFATNPTWGRLPQAKKNILQQIQKDYFQKLCDFLKPDIIFMGHKQIKEWQIPSDQLELLNSLMYKQLIENLTTKEGHLHPRRNNLKCFRATFGDRSFFIITGENMGRPFDCYTPDGLSPIMEAMKEFFLSKKTNG